MIHVQIARDITTAGVEGVRWVLVEASEGVPLAAPAQWPMPPTALQARAAARPGGSGQWRVALWQLAITGLGLLAALGMAQQQFGLPKLPWLGAPAVGQSTAPPPLPVAPAAAPPADAAQPRPAPAAPDARPLAQPPASDGRRPARPTPAASAGQFERLITAGLP